MKTIRHYASARDPLLHIETEGAVVNIRVGLSDRHGNAVTSVEIITDSKERGGDGEGRVWVLDGHTNNRIIRADAIPVDEDQEPIENLVVTITNPVGSEGAEYRLTLPDGSSALIGDAQDAYAELAGIIDDAFEDEGIRSERETRKARGQVGWEGA